MAAPVVIETLSAAETAVIAGGHNSRNQCPAAGHEHSTWDDLKETASMVWGWFS